MAFGTGLSNWHCPVDVIHILPDGSTQTHQELRKRVAKRDETARQPDTFLPDEEAISVAVEEQIGRIAFKEKRFAFAQDNVLNDADDFDPGAEH